jgi:hypothetical protein
MAGTVIKKPNDTKIQPFFEYKTLAFYRKIKQSVIGIGYTAPGPEFVIWPRCTCCL